MADDEIVVEIEKEEPEKKPDEKATDVADALKAQLTELQAETAREKAGRVAAEQRATTEAQARQAARYRRLSDHIRRAEAAVQHLRWIAASAELTAAEEHLRAAEREDIGGSSTISPQ